MSKTCQLKKRMDSVLSVNDRFKVNYGRTWGGGRRGRGRVEQKSLKFIFKPKESGVDMKVLKNKS